MASTLLLDTVTNDLVLDADGNIAAADEPYALAQDAASAIKTFLGECFYDTTVGVPWLTQILGQRPSLALLKETLANAAKTVPDVAAAQVFITAFSDRAVAGQVQVTSKATGQVAAAPFAAVSPQGGG